MMSYFFLKYVHVIGAIVVLGTGAGIAFFMMMAHRTKNPAFIAGTASVVVIADAIFIAISIIVQPISGYMLMLDLGIPFSETWIVASLVLYVVAGGFWLPVVWMQIRMRDLAQAAADADEALPETYHRLYRRWFAFGFLGFASVIAIVWLMIAQPTL